MQNTHYILFCLFLVALLLIFPSNSQTAPADTVRISFEEFTSMAVHYSADLQARRRNIELAENRVRQAQSARILPNLNLSTAHGLVPGVASRDPGITPGRYYLDPDLENDWENWGIFTQAEISGIQPLYTWGAIRNLVNAAQKGADVAHYQLDSEKETFILQLFELYQSALLVRELERLIDEALSQLEEAEEELERMRDEGDPSIEEKDVFEFNIFKAEFQALVAEVEQTRDFVRRSWNLVLSSTPEKVYQPAERFFDPVPVTLQDFGYYENNALLNRAELRGIHAAREAAQY